MPDHRIEDPFDEALPASRDRPAGLDQAVEDAYDRALQAARMRVRELLGQQEAAAALWLELEPHPPARRLLLVANGPRFRTWGLFSVLLRRSRETVEADPLEAFELAELAAYLVELLTAQLTRRQLADARADAQRAKADAHRLLGQYALARVCLEQGFIHLARGSQDPHGRACLLLSKAAWLEDVGRYDDAISGYGHAASLFCEIGESSREAEALLRQAGVLGHLTPARAVERIRSLLPRLDPHWSRLELIARHQMVWFTNDAGDPAEAARLFERAQPFYARFTDATVRLWRTWLQGRIARACGALADAERGLLCAYYVLTELRTGCDLMLCGLDLLEVYRLSGRTSLAERLSADLLADLEEWGFGDAAKEAWLAAGRCRSHEQFVRLALHIRRSWHRLSDGLDLGEA